VRNVDLIYFLEIMPHARWRDFALWCRFLREKMDRHKGYQEQARFDKLNDQQSKGAKCG